MTIQQIANELFNKIEPNGLKVIQSLPQKEDMIQFHHSTGRAIRNDYKLWSPDCPLTKPWHEASEAGTNTYIENGVDNHPDHPDHVSTLIMYEIWNLANSKQ